MNELYNLLPEEERKEVDIFVKDKYNCFLRKHNLAVVSVDDFNRLKRIDATVVENPKKRRKRMKVNFTYEGISYNNFRVFAKKYSLPYTKARDVFRELQDPGKVIAHFTDLRNSDLYRDNSVDF
jgi:hypothetical protein